jgi:polyphosphate kinase
VIRDVNALIDAAAAARLVALGVKIKARFDCAGQHQVGPGVGARGRAQLYGLIGLKTHAKRVWWSGAGQSGATPYRDRQLQPENGAAGRGDVGLLPAPDIGTTDLFNSLTGYSAQGTYRNLWWRRTGAQGDRRRIEREIAATATDRRRSG